MIKFIKNLCRLKKDLSKLNESAKILDRIKQDLLAFDPEDLESFFNVLEDGHREKSFYQIIVIAKNNTDDLYFTRINK